MADLRGLQCIDGMPAMHCGEMHGLFDAGLISFERGCVVVAAKVKDASVRALHGTALRLPQRRADWPNFTTASHDHARLSD